MVLVRFSARAAKPGANTVSVPLLIEFPTAAVIVTGVEAETGLVANENVTDCCPSAMETVSGTVAALLLLVR